MKRYLALLLLAIMVVSVVSAAGVATAASKKLATPKLLAPRHHAVLPASQSATFQWTAVRGATAYSMKIQIASRDALHPNRIVWLGVPGSVTPKTTASFGIGPGAYRWQVTALSSNPTLNSAPSAWHYFTAVK